MLNTWNQPSGILQIPKDKGCKEARRGNDNPFSAVAKEKNADDRRKKALQAAVTGF